jgi:hypothetical protein
MFERMRAGVVLCCVLASGSGCSSGGGVFQPPKASGIVVATLVGGSTIPATSSTNPLIVNNAFSISLSESNYSATFSATIVSYTAATSQSCYVVAMDGTQTIAIFTPRSAPAIPPGPCSPPMSDIEGVLFQDQQGHALTLYFQNRPS